MNDAKGPRLPLCPRWTLHREYREPFGAPSISGVDDISTPWWHKLWSARPSLWPTAIPPKPSVNGGDYVRIGQFLLYFRSLREPSAW